MTAAVEITFYMLIFISGPHNLAPPPMAFEKYDQCIKMKAAYPERQAYCVTFSTRERISE